MLNQLKRQRKLMPIRSRSLVKIRRFKNALLLTEQVLTEQNVNFIFIDKNERVIYPTNTALLNFTLTADQWKNLREWTSRKIHIE